MKLSGLEMNKEPFENFLETYQEEMFEDTQSGMTYNVLVHWVKKAYEAGRIDSLIKKPYWPSS